MLALKYVLMILGFVLLGSAGSLVTYDVFIAEQLRRLLRRRPVDEETVGPTVGTIYRQLAPNYLTHEIFAIKREELRVDAANAISGT